MDGNRALKMLDEMGEMERESTCVFLLGAKLAEETFNQEEWWDKGLEDEDIEKIDGLLDNDAGRAFLANLVNQAVSENIEMYGEFIDQVQSSMMSRINQWLLKTKKAKK